MSDLRDRIAKAACGATSAGKLFPWGTLSEAQRDSWRKVADAVIKELGLRQEWATQTSLMLGKVKLTQPEGAIAVRIGSPWTDLQELGSV